jgi:hypothetical protein
MVKISLKYFGEKKQKQKKCLMFDPKVDLTHKRQRKKEREEEVVVVVLLLQQEGRLQQQEETKQASRIIIT